MCYVGTKNRIEEITIEERSITNGFLWTIPLGFVAGSVPAMLIEKEATGADEYNMQSPWMWISGAVTMGIAVTATALYARDKKGKPTYREKIVSVETEECKIEPLANEEAVVLIGKADRSSGITDNEGHLSIPVTESIWKTLLEDPKSEFMVDVAGVRINGKLPASTDETFENRYSEYWKQQKTERSERLIDQFIETANSARDACKKRKTSALLMAEKLQTMDMAEYQLSEFEVESTLETVLATEKAFSACRKAVPRFLKSGEQFADNGQYRRAWVVFELVLSLDDENSRARQQSEKMLAVIELMKPNRISNFVLYSEGDGIVGYYSLVNKDNLLTTASGEVDLAIYVTNRGSPLQLCLRKKWEVTDGDFETATIGSGLFQRETTAHRLPFIKWSELQCSYIQTYLRSFGLQGLKRLDRGYGIGAQITFTTNDGEAMKAIEEISP